MSIKTVGDIINATKVDGLDALCTKAHALTALGRLFASTLDAKLAPHCHLAQIDGEELWVVVDNSSWGARLRYAAPDILKDLQLQPEFKNIKKISYRVSSQAGETDSAEHKPSKHVLPPAVENVWRDALARLRSK